MVDGNFEIIQVIVDNLGLCLNYLPHIECSSFKLTCKQTFIIVVRRGSYKFYSGSFLLVVSVCIK